MSHQDMRDTMELLGQAKQLARVEVPRIVAEIIPNLPPAQPGTTVHYHIGPIVINVGHNAECNLGNEAVFSKQKIEEARHRRW